MDRKRMAELSGVPGLVEAVQQTEAADDVDVSVRRFPEVVQVTGFIPATQDWERTLKDIPLPSLTTNIDKAAFRLMNLGVLALDAEGLAWKIYLTPQATDGQVDAAIEMARKALIPTMQRYKADWLSGYKPQQPMESTDKIAQAIVRTLASEFEKGGYARMMEIAYKIEAGQVVPGSTFFKRGFLPSPDRKKWLIGALSDIAKHPKVKLSKSELARLMMYRDDLRRGR
jgi:hypothetical protein